MIKMMLKRKKNKWFELIA